MFFPFIFTIVAIFCAPVQETLANSGVNTSPAGVSLESRSVKHGQSEANILGLHFKMEEGWKIYAPPPEGKETSPYAGTPPEVQWSGSQNIKKAKILWPSAQKFDSPVGSFYGYQTEAFLPVSIEREYPQSHALLLGRVSFFACREICIPVEMRVEKALFSRETFLSNSHEIAAVLGWQTGSEFSSLLWMVGIALVGGIILNFMPCVLPVLALKIFSFYKVESLSALRKRSGLTVLGILTSFLFLSALTLLLSGFGHAVSWGLHFQNPLFLSGMVGVLGVFSANLWGWFEIMPPALQKIHERTAGGDYLSGVFATLLATPCSAPFVGTAISFAFTKTWWETLTIFLAMGIGFSSPYLVALVLPPRWIRLPKPGPWMGILKNLLGGGVMATALWLGWIFVKVTDPRYGAALFLLMAFLLGGLALWPHRKGLVMMLGVGSMSLLSLVPLPSFQVPSEPKLAVPFELDQIARSVAAGKVVFVNITADWCLTCHANKLLILSRSEIQNLFESEDILYMEGDWTRKDASILSYLKTFNRYGIPFTAVYGPSAPNGIALPELLTTERIKEALLQASNRL